jgi:hypothetical protein
MGLTKCLIRWFTGQGTGSRARLASVVVPATLAFFAVFAAPALAGNLWVTGHDQDFHCSNGDPDSCSYYKITTSFVGGGSGLPYLIVDRDSTSDGAAGSSGQATVPWEAVASLNLAYSNNTSSTPTGSSPRYFAVDPQGTQPSQQNGALPPGVSPSDTWGNVPLVDSKGHPLWSAIIIASDTNCGGCDLNNVDGTHVDSDAINARASAIHTFFNDGGGLLYLAGATNSYQADGVTGRDVYYAPTVPVPVGGQPVSPPFTVQPPGAAFGVTSAMANCCATHNSFTLPGKGSLLQVAETDSSGLAESLFLQTGTVCSSGFCILPPVLGKAFDVRVVSGSISIKRPGGKGFTPIFGSLQIPAGTIIDAYHGTIELTAASKKKGKTYVGDFSGDAFKTTQVGGGPKKGLTTLTLMEGVVPGTPSFKSCKGKAADGPSAEAARFRLSTLRSRGSGRFRTRGRYGAGTVHGTAWTTTDRCDGTLFKVSKGVVAVADFKKHKTVLVRAHHSYLAHK